MGGEGGLPPPLLSAEEGLSPLFRPLSLPASLPAQHCCMVETERLFCNHVAEGRMRERRRRRRKEEQERLRQGRERGGGGEGKEEAGGSYCRKEQLAAGGRASFAEEGSDLRKEVGEQDREKR